MYYRSGTAERCCSMCRADTSCAFSRGRYFSEWNYVMAAILKLWLQMEENFVNRWIFIWPTFLPNFTPIRF